MVSLIELLWTILEENSEILKSLHTQTQTENFYWHKENSLLKKSFLIADEAQAQTKYVKIRHKSPRVLQPMSTPVQKAPIILRIFLLSAVCSK